MRTAFPTNDDGLDVKTVINALRRRKGIILTTMILVTAWALASALLITPRYVATAVVLVKPNELRDAGRGEWGSSMVPSRPAAAAAACGQFPS